MIPVIYVSSGFFHPGWPNRRQLRAVLERVRTFAIRQVGSLDALPELVFPQTRALVLYMHARALSTSALDRLEAFVASGGGVLAVHSAAASFKSEPRFHALLGGKFTGHGPVGRFTVQPANPPDPLFSVQTPFTLRDERYLHETYADIRVHFTSSVGGPAEPFVWTRQHGAGRVCYCAAGHTLAALRHPAVRSILLEGLAWAAGVAR